MCECSSLSSWHNTEREKEKLMLRMNKWIMKSSSVNNLYIYMIELTWDVNELELLSSIILSLRLKFSFRCRNDDRTMHTKKEPLHSIQLDQKKVSRDLLLFYFNHLRLFSCKWSSNVMNCPFYPLINTYVKRRGKRC